MCCLFEPKFFYFGPDLFDTSVILLRKIKNLKLGFVFEIKGVVGNFCFCFGWWRQLVLSLRMSNRSEWNGIPDQKESDIIVYDSSRWKYATAFISLGLLIVVAVAVTVVVVMSDKDARPNSPRNLIFIVSDGMGPESLNYAREMGTFNASSPKPLLPIDKYLIGHVRTYSDDMVITDSASAATAYSCQQLTYNAAVAVLSNGNACATLLEAAKREGFVTGDSFEVEAKIPPLQMIIVINLTFSRRSCHEHSRYSCDSRSLHCAYGRARPGTGHCVHANVQLLPFCRSSLWWGKESIRSAFGWNQSYKCIQTE